MQSLLYQNPGMAPSWSKKKCSFMYYFLCEVLGKGPLFDKAPQFYQVVIRICSKVCCQEDICIF